MTLLKISNKALRKLGVKEINSLTQQGRAADRCNRAVEDIVREVTESHTWSHSTKWDTLPQLVANPPFGYQYAYQAPIEILTLFDVRSVESLDAPSENYEMVRGKIVYTDAEPCYARFAMYMESDLVLATPTFIDACAYRLAAEIAMPLSKTELMASMMQGYYTVVRDAASRDNASSEVREPDENIQCKMLAARQYPAQDDLRNR